MSCTKSLKCMAQLAIRTQNSTPYCKFKRKPANSELHHCIADVLQMYCTKSPNFMFCELIMWFILIPGSNCAKSAQVHYVYETAKFTHYEPVICTKCENGYITKTPTSGRGFFVLRGFLSL